MNELCISIKNHNGGIMTKFVLLIRNAVDHLGKYFPLQSDDNVYVITDNNRLALNEFNINWHFAPPRGWIGNIERE